MLDSPWLEVAIGLVVTFFLIALAASAIVEFISRLLSKRAKDLDKALDDLMSDDKGENPKAKIQHTAVFKSIAGLSGKRIHKSLLGKPTPKSERNKPSYLSAKAFADSASELIIKAGHEAKTGADLLKELPPGLQARLHPIVVEVGSDLLAIKAELESWFDTAMERLEGAYKRWSQAVLFVVGLAITIGANASAYRIGVNLYADPALADAVANAAATISENAPVTPGDTAAPLADIAEKIEGIQELGLPIGWENWDSKAGPVGTVLGWGLTSILVMAGAPFWYDLLTKLVSMRSSGRKPSQAPNDSSSATAAVMNRVTSPAAPAPLAPGAAAAIVQPPQHGRAALAQDSNPHASWEDALLASVKVVS